MQTLQSFCPQPPDWAVDWDGLKAAFDWIPPLHACPQDPRFHTEGDVGIHTRMVCEALAGLPEWRSLDVEHRFELFVAALMHDIGKPECTREQQGRITSFVHSRVGSIMARHILWELGVPFRLRERICGLIRHHQVPFFLVDTDDAQHRLIALNQVVRCDHLALLARADILGRICDGKSETLDNIALFVEYARELDCLNRPFPFASDHSRFLYFQREGRKPRYRAHDDTRCTMVILSGLPASGKNHWVSLEGRGRPVVELDRIRRELGVDHEGPQGRVVSAALKEARSHLAAGRDFIWNATNLGRSRRNRLVRLAADYHARVEIIYLEASPSTLKARNARRPSPVPDKAIERMMRHWRYLTSERPHTLSYLVGNDSLQ